MPTREQLVDFINKLPAMLKENGIDIDLNRPEDTVRLSILDFEQNPNSLNDNDITEPVETLAFLDKNKHPDTFDHIHATSEELFNSQTANLTDEQMEKIYNAAQEGKFFIRPPFSKNRMQMQIVVDKEGNPKLMEDVNHPTPEQEEITRLFNAPKPGPKPKSPGWFTYVKAFFGVDKAKREITNYRNRVQEHQEKTAAYNERLEKLPQHDPDLQKFTLNCTRASQNFFQIPGEFEMKAFVQKLNVLSLGLETSKKYDDFMEKADLLEYENIQSIKEIAKTTFDREPYEVGEDFTKKAAECIADNRAIESFKLDFHKGQLTEEKINKYAALIEKGNPAREANIKSIEENPALKKVQQNIRRSSIRDISLGGLGVLFDEFRNQEKKLAKLSQPKVEKSVEKNINIETVAPEQGM